MVMLQRKEKPGLITWTIQHATKLNIHSLIQNPLQVHDSSEHWCLQIPFVEGCLQFTTASHT